MSRLCTYKTFDQFFNAVNLLVKDFNLGDGVVVSMSTLGERDRLSSCLAIQEGRLMVRALLGESSNSRLWCMRLF